MNEDTLRRDLEYVTQAKPLPEGEGLAAVLHRLDAVAGEAGLPERLQHYLEKRSYVKALTWLDNPEAPHHP